VLDGGLPARPAARVLRPHSLPPRPLRYYGTRDPTLVTANHRATYVAAGLRPAPIARQLDAARPVDQALLPLRVGAVTVAGALGGVLAVAAVTELSIYALNIVTASGSGWRSTTAGSSSPATARKHSVPATGARHFAERCHALALP
jgi:hypothetical protein